MNNINTYCTFTLLKSQLPKWKFACTYTLYMHLLSMARNVSLGVPKGVLSLANRQYWADSYVAQNHNRASQLPTYMYQKKISITRLRKHPQCTCTITSLNWLTRLQNKITYQPPIIINEVDKFLSRDWQIISEMTVIILFCTYRLYQNIVYPFNIQHRTQTCKLGLLSLLTKLIAAFNVAYIPGFSGVGNILQSLCSFRLLS